MHYYYLLVYVMPNNEFTELKGEIDSLQPEFDNLLISSLCSTWYVLCSKPVTGGFFVMYNFREKYE